MNRKVILFILIAILGVYCLGKGITGLVVSQSCCFPPDCDSENLCDVAKESFEMPIASYFFTGFGMVLILISLIALVKRKRDPLDM